MMSKKRESTKKIFIIFLVLSISSCAQKSVYPYFDSAINDKNRAPSSVALPSDENSSAPKMNLAFEQSKADFKFLSAEIKLQEGENAEAIEELKSAYELDQKSGYLAFRLAQLQFRNNKPYDAVKWIETALSLDSKNLDHKMLAGHLYSTLKDYGKAERIYLKIISENKKEYEAYLYLAAVYSEQKKYTESIDKFNQLLKAKDYEQKHLAYYFAARTKFEWNKVKYISEIKTDLKKSLKIKPDYLEALQFLGQIIEKTEGKKKVFTIYEEHQKKYGPIPRLAEVLSQYYIELGQYDKAFEQLKIVEANTQDPIQVKLKMSLILIDKKQYDKALIRLEELSQMVPESDKVKFYLGSIYQELKNNENALLNYQQILPSSKHYTEAQKNIISIYRETNQNKLALPIVQKMTQEKPEVIEGHILYAQILEDEKEYDQAIKYLKKVVEKFPKEAQIYYVLGSVYDKKQDKKKMFENMYKAIELNPQFPLALNYLAYSILESNENLKKAEEFGLRAYNLDKTDPYIADTVGWIYFYKKEYTKAVKYLEQAHDLVPNVSIIAEHLGDVYVKLNKFEKAAIVYRKAVEFELNIEKQKQIISKITAIKLKDDNQVRYPSDINIKKLNASENGAEAKGE